MFKSLTIAVLTTALSLPIVSAGTVPAVHELSTRANLSYKLTRNVVGRQFYDNFRFFSGPDPTAGLVEYQTLENARRLNLTSADAGSFIIAGDSTSILKPGQGRKSTRIESSWTLGNHVHILDLGHMPAGRSSWPAYWLVGPNWPNGGEIDIIEGANDIMPNLMTIHTTPGCTMDGMTNRTQTGKIKAQDCNAYANGNVGCGVYGTKGNDFGPKLNAGNGGYFAFQRSDTEVKVWFWKRYSANIPKEIIDPYRTVVNPSTWGVPDAHFGSSSTCQNFNSMLARQTLVINLTYCGGFGGHTFVPGGTPACEEFCRNNPQALSEAYWKIYGLRVYE
ncbi:glycoside hydrolase family 16 protein [Auriculariales sp. MPI-PUGE-AT-0066]|nr:glycoside hydrolase family 16 protein [Auriculariales sp. MPI-PUGE-AT-0066]